MALKVCVYEIYSWLFFNNNLKTTDMLTKWNIEITKNCYFFISKDEFINHLSFECTYTYNLLGIVLPQMASYLLMPTLLQLTSSITDMILLSDRRKKLYLFIVSCLIYQILCKLNKRRNGSNIANFITLSFTKNALQYKACPWYKNG